MKQRILIVEDDVHSQKIAKAIIEHHRTEVGIARNAEEAMQMLAQEYFSAVLIDLTLPGVSGWELKTQIHEQIGNLPCIAFTAFHSSKVAQEAIDAGFAGYFSKPLDISHFYDDLIAKIEMAGG